MGQVDSERKMLQPDPVVRVDKHSQRGRRRDDSRLTNPDGVEFEGLDREEGGHSNGVFDGEHVRLSASLRFYHPRNKSC